MPSPETRAQAQANAQTKATNRGQDAEHTARVVQEDLDQYDSRWNKDPGRAAGPFT